MTREEREDAINFFKEVAEREVNNAKYSKLAIEALEQEHWIPVSKRLPEIHQNVLLSLRSLDIEVGFRAETEPYFYCNSINGCYVESKNVIAWMPLPEPYREE